MPALAFPNSLIRTAAWFLLSLLLLLGMGLAARAADEAIASGARLGGDGQESRFVLELDKPVAFRVFTLADPYRVILDMPQVNFQLKKGQDGVGAGLISAYRYGVFSEGKSRIVIDVLAPVAVRKSFMLKPVDGKPARLVLDLVRTDRSGFLAHTASAAAARRAERARQRRVANSLRGVNVPLPRTKPRMMGAGGKRRPVGKPVVVIDPGHGGIDPGASGRRGSKEKHLVLAFSKTLYAKLKASGRYDVHMTRTRDVFIRLSERVRIASRHHADLFISIHADSIRRGNIRGATIYTLSEKSSDKEAAALAAKENRADIIAGVDLEDAPDELAGIFIDLAQREAKNESIKFARTAIRSMQHIRLNRNPHRYAGFRVLKSPNFPSVLIELGYLSSRKDEKLLSSKRWRNNAAGAVAQAINGYFRKRLANR